MTGILQRIVVEERKLISSEDMMKCIALSQGMPGVMAISMSTFIGRKKGGVKGAVASSVGVILPSLIVVIILSIFLNKIENIVNLEIVFTMLKATVSAIVLNTAMNLGDKVLLKNWNIFVAGISFLAMSIWKINVIYIIVLSFVIGLIFASIKNKDDSKDKEVKL